MAHRTGAPFPSTAGPANDGSPEPHPIEVVIGRGTGREPHPRLGPLGTSQGPANPTSPQKTEKRMMGSAKLCAVIARPAEMDPGG